MFRFLYLPLLGSVLVATLLITSCKRMTSDSEDIPTYAKEGERFTATIRVNDQILEEKQLRSGGIDDIDHVDNLRVLVFDENQNFLYSEMAELKGSTTDLSKISDYLPDHKPEGITKIREFKVSLISSSKRRFIHFIANHDWTGFTQDYYAKGSAAGKLMTDSKLTNAITQLWGSDPKGLGLWSIVDTERLGLDENTFKNKVVKLLRNYAKVTVSTDQLAANNTEDESFEVESYTICNVSDRGTIAPFETSGYHYEFPFNPGYATTPVGVKISNDEDNLKINRETPNFVNKTEPYFLFEKDNIKPEKRTYLIIKGKRTNKVMNIYGETRYYKVDLVQSKIGHSALVYFPIIRNKHYVVNINSVKSDGFGTIQEAIESPAGNNVFADTQLQDFSKISDGISHLLVDPLHLIVVKPGVYTVKTNYVTPNGDGYRYIKYYPSWNTKDVKENGETGYSYENATDPYLGFLKKIKEGEGEGFTFDVKSIPEYGKVTYTVEVIALRQHNGQPVVDGYTGATTPITRQVRITINAPYLFNASFEKTSALVTNTDGSLSSDYIHNLKFRVYEPDLISKNSFPFEVLIRASGITPVNPQETANKLTIELIKNPETGVLETFYRYTVLESDQTAGWATIPFKVNDPTKGYGRITLSSQFYRDQTLSSAQKDETVLTLYYQKPNGYGVTSRLVPSRSTFTFNYKGQEYSSEQLSDKFGINLQPLSSAGKFRFSVYNTQNLDDNLTITSYDTFGSNDGTIRYTFTATKKLREWVSGSNSTHYFSTNRVQMKGRVHFWKKSSLYSSWYPVYSKPTDSYRFYASNKNFNVLYFKSSEFKILDDVQYDNSGYPYFEFELDTSNMNYFTNNRPDLVLFYSDSARYPYAINGKSLEDYESKPSLDINVGRYQ
ncbi:hypothetical protein IX308_001832 [Porphyromonas levii]|nr:hypothetical protein [Porphyromonas levii]MBR8714091.1 hypothetical protein [Porphyromonas levii]MBR8716085.1 hypothetical protein [Porphyromonas levii]MBR8728623.1 hypothetical protein [Porphyromonas levii]MBR8736932.1 hypothetical protein [Porphyromonas levii]